LAAFFTAAGSIRPCSVPGTVGDVGLLRQPLGGGLVAEAFEQVGGGPDERDAVLGARPGQVGVLGEEPVTRVDRVDAVLLGDRHQRRDVEVTLDRRPALFRPDLV
jgi:hypothetical protein